MTKITFKKNNIMELKPPERNRGVTIGWEGRGQRAGHTHIHKIGKGRRRETKKQMDKRKLTEQKCGKIDRQKLQLDAFCPGFAHRP